MQGNIEKLDAKKLDKFKADIWMLSPPCQPFTRRGLQKDLGDNRTRSFISLLGEIAQMRHHPQYLLVENVVGFEVSDMRNVLAEKLQSLGYQMQEFILTPTQYGIPYSRPRYGT
jgi:tRNA (cytosine38-C5)-methyltransferase